MHASLTKWLSLDRGICIFLSCTFLWAAIPKIAKPESFALTILNFRIISPKYSEILAYTLPPFELVLAALFLLRGFTVIAAYISAIMVIVYITVLAQASVKGLQIDCGCFGGIAEGPKEAILRDIILLAVDCVVIARSWRRRAETC